MAKIEGYFTDDNRGRNCLVLKKKKGHINQREAYEWLESHNRRGCSFVHMVDCPEEVPVELYDEEGDTWVLYEPEDVLSELVARAEMQTGTKYRLVEE